MEWVVGIVIIIAIYGEFELREQRKKQQSELRRLEVAIGDSASSNSAEAIQSQIDDTNNALFLSRTFAVVVVPLGFLFWYTAYKHQSTGNGWEILDAIMFTVVACVLMVWFFISCVLVALGTSGLRTPDYGAFANLENRRDPDERKRRSRLMLWIGLAGNAIGLAGLAWLYFGI